MCRPGGCEEEGTVQHMHRGDKRRATSPDHGGTQRNLDDKEKAGQKPKATDVGMLCFAHEPYDPVGIGQQ